MEIGIWLFLGCSVIALSLVAFAETKSQKRFWKWRDDMLSALQSISNEKEVIVLTAADFEKIKELGDFENEN